MTNNQIEFEIDEKDKNFPASQKVNKPFSFKRAKSAPMTIVIKGKYNITGDDEIYDLEAGDRVYFKTVLDRIVRVKDEGEHDK